MRVIGWLAAIFAGVITLAVFLLLRVIGWLACLAGGISGLVFVISTLAWLAWHHSSHWTAMLHSGEAAASMLAIAIICRYGVLLLAGEDATAHAPALHGRSGG